MRLVDVDKFILALMDASLSSVDEDTILDLVDSVPIVDVAPVVHGRWIYDKKAQRPYCSVCKGYFYGATNSPMSYCPKCGAMMDGEP
nr:MAG TPA: hydrogenase/urease nickel incorporation protein [Caudoviricetes sp.]